MTCNACVKHVDTALRGVHGVSAVDVDLESGYARIVHDGKPKPATLIAAIAVAGYEAGEVPSQ